MYFGYSGIIRIRLFDANFTEYVTHVYIYVCDYV